jgi:hypothetical protein
MFGGQKNCFITNYVYHNYRVTVEPSLMPSLASAAIPVAILQNLMAMISIDSPVHARFPYVCLPSPLLSIALVVSLADSSQSRLDLRSTFSIPIVAVTLP